MKIQKQFRQMIFTIVSLYSLLSPAAVAIVETPIKNQYNFPFCWSYTMMAHYEQLSLKRADGWLDLSEEYVGFYHVADQILHGNKKVYFGGELTDAIVLAGEYGLVPEEAFNFKLIVPPTQDIQAMMDQAIAAFREENKLSANASIGLEQALSLVEKVFNTPHIPRPHEKFSFRGRTYTPKTFAHERVKLNPQDFYVMKMVNPQENPVAYQAQQKMIKKALLYGYTVPYNLSEFLPLDSNTGAWSCAGKPCDQMTAKDAAGGHTFLISDFATANVAAGAVTSAEMVQAFSEPVLQWIGKNSWGEDYLSRVQVGHLPRQRNLDTWMVLPIDYSMASDRINQNCTDCDFSRPTLLTRNTSYEEGNLFQALVVLPAAIYNLPLSTKDHLRGLTLVEQNNLIEQRELYTSPKTPEVLGAVIGASPAPPSAPAPITATIELEKYSGDTYNQPMMLDLSQDLVVDANDSATLALQVKVLDPHVKSVSLSLAQDKSGGPPGDDAEFWDSYVTTAGHSVMYPTLYLPSKDVNKSIVKIILQPQDVAGRAFGPPLDQNVTLVRSLAK